MTEWEDERDTSVENRRAALRALPTPATNGERPDLDTTVGMLMGGLSRVERDLGTLGREVHALARAVGDHQAQSRENAVAAATRTARRMGGLLVVAAVVYNELRPWLGGLLHGH